MLKKKRLQCESSMPLSKKIRNIVYGDNNHFIDRRLNNVVWNSPQFNNTQRLLKWKFLFHIELMQGHMEMVGDTFLLHYLCQTRKPIFGGPSGWSSWWASIKNLLYDHCWDFSHSGYLVVVVLCLAVLYHLGEFLQLICLICLMYCLFSHLAQVCYL